MVALSMEIIGPFLTMSRGTRFLFMLKLLRRDERFNSSGAFAGLIAGLDMREMYIKDM